MPDKDTSQNAGQEPGVCPLTPPADYAPDPVVVAYLSDSRAVEPGESDADA